LVVFTEKSELYNSRKNYEYQDKTFEGVDLIKLRRKKPPLALTS
jgi:hypothetical protein